MRKNCEICNKEFETIQFGHQRKYCFECVPQTDNFAERTAWKRQAAKREAVKRLGGKCKKCGESRPHILDFHHINPNEKDDTPSRLLANSKIQDFFFEIEKCILLCSNCHQDFHWLSAYDKELTIDLYLDSNIE